MLPDSDKPSVSPEMTLTWTCILSVKSGSLLSNEDRFFTLAFGFCGQEKHLLVQKNILQCFKASEGSVFGQY